MLSQQWCKERQRRLRERLAAAGVDAAVLTDLRDITYFTGLLLSKFPALLFLETSGDSWLAAHTDEGEALTGDRIAYEWHKLGTMNPDPLRQLNAAVAKRLKGHAAVARVGWQEEAMPNLLADTVVDALHPGAWSPVDDLLAGFQKRKDPDEVDLLRKSIRTCAAAYEAARKAIAPGVNEMDVLAAGQRAAMREAGEPIWHGGDYQCNALGGPARNRRIEAGELYVIDAQSVCQGYNADTCRTFAVGTPTDLQQSVYDHIAGILRDVPNLVKPGDSATALWKTLDARIREHARFRDIGLIHHGGHGVGLRAHEAPDINRDRDGLFEVGDVFSCEPGAYCDEMRHGVRLENTFLITESGVENLCDYPLSLT